MKCDLEANKMIRLILYNKDELLLIYITNFLMYDVIRNFISVSFAY